MGITLGRWMQLSIFLGSVMLSSTSYAGTINASYVEFFAQPIDVTTTTVIDGLGYAAAVWDDDVYRANVGIFTEVDGLPAELITQTGPFDPISGTYDFPVTPAATLSAGSYWVVGGYNRGGDLENENDEPDYVDSLPSSWTFGEEFYYLYEDVQFYAVTAEQDVPDASATGDINSIVTLDTGGRHLIIYDVADIEEYDSTATIFIDAEDASVVDDTTTAGGDVDGLDYLVWAANFGSNSTPRTFTPEPTTCSLLVFGALPLMFSRRRSR